MVDANAEEAADLGAAPGRRDSGSLQRLTAWSDRCTAHAGAHAAPLAGLAAGGGHSSAALLRSRGRARVGLNTHQLETLL